MKMTTGILGCALATGLMTFAADKAQAAVINGELYVPVNIKLAVSYYGKNDKLSQYRVTSKDVLKQLGYGKGYQLASSFGNDVYLITKSTVVADLTSDGYVTMDLNDQLDNETGGKNGSYKYTESGILSLDVYNSPVFGEGLDKVASEEASSEWFEISGYYTYGEKGSASNNNNQGRNYSVKIKAKALSGLGHDSSSDLDVPFTTTVTGSVTASGSGKVSIQ
jgi:hypothetical protein